MSGPRDNPPSQTAALFAKASRIAKVFVLVAIPLMGAAYFASFYNDFYPVKEWLFWRYAAYWACCAFWCAGCTMSGYALVRKLARSPLPVLETAVLSFSSGVVIYYVAMNIIGGLGGFHTSTFFVLPLAMMATGAAPTWRTVRRWRRHVRFRRHTREPRSWLVTLIWIFGLVGLAMIYMKMLTPENVQFDSRWKHLALAEQYAHAGVIPRFGEGWTVATNPHLATIIYTWAFMAPGARLFDQVAMAAHMELVCFLWSCAGISALVRLLVPGVRTGAAWAARFLFPGVMLYDSSLSGGADHIAALFAAPVFIALLRALPKLARGRCALLGIVMAGAALPKLTAGMLIVPIPALAITGRAVWLLGARLRKRDPKWYLPLAGAFVGGGAALAATSPFWLRNWIWYGDPLYPSLHPYLTLTPWTADAADVFAYGYKEYQFWRPEHNYEGFKETLKALATFSFVPNNYKRFHGMVPVFGSLMTLMLPCLLLLKRTKRIWGLALAVHVALFAWYWVHHQDRYLQTLVPWMAAIVAAITIKLWHSHVLARVSVSLLIATQILIGGDVYFIESHAMIKAPIKRSLDLLGSGYRKKYGARLNVFRGWTQVRDRLPADAKVLLHDNHTHLGLSRRTASDWNGWQFGISYGRSVTPRAVYDQMRELGVTHVVWRHAISKGWDSIGGDLVFFDFAMRHTVKPKRVGSMWIGLMPSTPPPDEPAGLVAVFACKDYYKSGLYNLADLTTPVFGPQRFTFAEPVRAAKKGEERAIIGQAAFVVIDPVCGGAAAKVVNADFELVAKRKLVNSKRRRRGKRDWQLYLRK